MRAPHVGLALAVLAVAAHAATESPLPQGAASAAAPADVSASAPVPSATSSVGVPALQVEWNCGECKANEKVPSLIQSGYADAAGASKLSVFDGDKVNVQVTAFHQRNPALRSLFGFMAGKDELSVSVSWHGRQATVHDYAANALQGMNAVAQSVGKKTFAAVQKWASDERAGASSPAR